jgi:hypothetical protein
MSFTMITTSFHSVRLHSRSLLTLTLRFHAEGNYDWHRDQGRAPGDHADDTGEKTNCDEGHKFRSWHGGMIRRAVFSGKDGDLTRLLAKNPITLIDPSQAAITLK